MWKRLNFAEKLEFSLKTRTDPSLDRHGSSEDGFAPLLVLPGDSNSGSRSRPDRLACSVASFAYNSPVLPTLSSLRAEVEDAISSVLSVDLDNGLNQKIQLLGSGKRIKRINPPKDPSDSKFLVVHICTWQGMQNEGHDETEVGPQGRAVSFSLLMMAETTYGSQTPRTSNNTSKGR
ncbi:hypothetical protein TIFTF001_014687 [Ficus carica]|uniref:Uncharacterized protein n=1 Tax=Ficus carica TaxID=3494 RepID=A0AA88A493_FICCA|nr:hypothetical protein TIFTF001_014687 [Ficus carica]